MNHLVTLSLLVCFVLSISITFTSIIIVYIFVKMYFYKNASLIDRGCLVVSWTVNLIKHLFESTKY